MDERRQRFEALVLPHLDAAYRFARWLTRSPDGPEDIVQEAVLRAYRSFDTLRGSDAKAWLLTIVRNCHWNALKQQRRHAAEPIPEEQDGLEAPVLVSDAPDPESASIRRDQQRTLERLLRALPEDQREVLILREMEDMGYREMAAVLNVPVGTVMSRLARARAALRKQGSQAIAGVPDVLP